MTYKIVSKITRIPYKSGISLREAQDFIAEHRGTRNDLEIVKERSIDRGSQCAGERPRRSAESGLNKNLMEG